MFAAQIQNRSSLCCFLTIVVILSAAPAARCQDPAFEDLDRFGRESVQHDNYVAAIRYFRHQVERLETGKVSNPNLVVAFGNLAEALRLTGQYDESEKLFDRAFGIPRTGAAMHERQAAVLLNNRGRLYQETGRYALAQSDLKQGQRPTQRAFGARHSQMVQVLNSLGALYSAMDRRKDAGDRLKKATGTTR